MDRKVFLRSKLNTQYVTEDSEDLDGTIRSALYTEPPEENIDQALFELQNSSLSFEQVAEAAKVMLMATHFQLKLDDELLKQVLITQLERHYYLLNQAKQQNLNDVIDQLQENIYLLLWVVNKHQIYVKVYNRDMVQLIQQLQDVTLQSKQLMFRIILNIMIDSQSKFEQVRVLGESNLTDVRKDHVCQLFTKKMISQHEVRFFIRTIFDLIKYCIDKQINIDEFASMFIMPTLDYLDSVQEKEQHFVFNCIRFIKEMKYNCVDAIFLMKFALSNNNLVKTQVIRYFDDQAHDNQLQLLTNTTFMQRLLTLIQQGNADAMLLLFNIIKDRDFRIASTHIQEICFQMRNVSLQQFFVLVECLAHLNASNLDNEAFGNLLVSVISQIQRINPDHYLHLDDTNTKKVEMKSFLTDLVELTIQMSNKMEVQQAKEELGCIVEFACILMDEYNIVRDFVQIMM